ncbi:MAG: Glyoxalase/bleomycin resistance protein/dioxygenase [Firmicutes bacterium]|nr:Glyoxalase/bleomycin resistance protein/dioxygenase [Bacillota bacterium]
MKYCWTTLQVKDMEVSLKFYKEVVGLKENRRFSSAPGKEYVFLGEGETELELICDQQKKEVEVGQDISLGFEVDSLDRMLELVKERGYAVHSGPFQPNPHVKFFFVQDPTGWKIQFVENM